MAILYMVATPIGNLEDITVRAARVLAEVDVIACEDTRHTSRLLAHLGVKKQLIACHAQDEAKGSERILSFLGEGKRVAYCSDAGTPCLSDPGILAASLAREAGHDVVPIPGPSAFAALASAAGIFFKALTFEGFSSTKAGRRRARLEELMAREEAFVLYESPHRIVKLLAELADIDGTRRVCVGREMTKLHEEFNVGSAAELHADYAGRESVKGEFAVLVAPAPKPEKAPKSDKYAGKVDRFASDGDEENEDPDDEDDGTAFIEY